MAQHSQAESQGKKRPAEGDPEEDQPLAKKFGRLHIDPVARCYSREKQREPSPLQQTRGRSDDAMMLDDTKHTIYIHDLEHDMEELEPLDNYIKILPGLEDKSFISRVLAADTKPQSNELVLYQEPISLSIPKERDNVRKALIATRERSRVKTEYGSPCYWTPLGSALSNPDDDSGKSITAEPMDIDGRVGDNIV